MVLRVSLLPGPKRSFRPGELFQATVEVQNQSDKQSDKAFDILVEKFYVEVISTERVDHTWIALAYGADVSPVEKDNRRETREIFRSKARELTGRMTLRPGEQKSWRIRMTLPEWLPPSFRGVSARYGHLLKATISFSGSPSAMQQLTKHLSLEGSRRASAGSLLRLESQGKRTRLGSQGRRKEEQHATQAATAKVPILLLPNQVHAGFSERVGGLSFPQLVIGDDSELLPVAYAHASSSDALIEAQEIQPGQRSSSSQAGISHKKLAEKLSGVSLQNTASPPKPARSDPENVKQEKTEPEAGSSWQGQHKQEEAQDPDSGLQSKSEYNSSTVDPDRWPGGIPATPMTGIEAPSLKSFNLRLSDNMLARLTLHPPTDGPLCLGATLSGTVDFRDSQEAASSDMALPKCVQMMVLLETEEKVHQRWSVASNQLISSGIRHVQDEHQELTPNTLMTHFMLSVPQDAPASFCTSLIALRWILRFEFLTTSKPTAVGWLSGGGKTSEQLSWALPILVKPSRV